MRLSPLLLGFAALGLGWAAPAAAQDGADCGILCQIGGYLSSDHMTASPGEGGAAAASPAKAHKAHVARKAPAKPAQQVAGDAHSATTPPPATVHGSAKVAVAAGAKLPGRTTEGVKVAATEPASPKPVGARHGAATEQVADSRAQDRAAPAVVAKVAPAKTSLAKTPPTKTSLDKIPPAQIAAAQPAKGLAHAARPQGAAVKAALDAKVAKPAESRAAERAGGTVELASAPAMPVAAPAKPARARATAQARRLPAAAPPDAERPVIRLSALSAIPGSAPAMPAGFQPFSPGAR